MTKQNNNVIIGRNEKGCYTVNGTPLRSVTTYLGDVLGLPPTMVQFFHAKYGWDEAQRLMHIAGDYGTARHDELEEYYFKSHEVAGEIARRIEHIDNYFEEHNIKPLFGEQTLWSFKLKTAGKCDFIGIDIVNGRYYILDWKTGTKTAYKELMQTGTYGALFIERQNDLQGVKLPFPATIDNIYGLVVHIGKKDSVKPKFQVFTPADMKKGLKGFKSIVQIYNLKRSIK